MQPYEVIEGQLQAYNARAVDAFCSFYATDARVSAINGEELCRGQDAIRTLYTKVFTENARLHCTIEKRIALGNFVVDHEQVTGLEADLLETIAIYEVHDSLIQSVLFIPKG
jgi:hypothetical protein